MIDVRPERDEQAVDFVRARIDVRSQAELPAHRSRQEPRRIDLRSSPRKPAQRAERQLHARDDGRRSQVDDQVVRSRSTTGSDVGRPCARAAAHAAWSGSVTGEANELRSCRGRARRHDHPPARAGPARGEHPDVRPAARRGDARRRRASATWRSPAEASSTPRSGAASRARGSGSARCVDRLETPLAMALRGRFLVGSHPVDADFVRRFIASAAQNGIEVFRLNDPLNDVSNLREAAEAIADAGAELAAGLVYSSGPTGETEPLVEQASQLPRARRGARAPPRPDGSLQPHRAQRARHAACTRRRACRSASTARARAATRSRSRSRPRAPAPT